VVTQQGDQGREERLRELAWYLYMLAGDDRDGFVDEAVPLLAALVDEVRADAEKRGVTRGAYDAVRQMAEAAEAGKREAEERARKAEEALATARDEDAADDAKIIDLEAEVAQLKGQLTMLESQVRGIPV
jgi:hypothetical protein